MTLRNRNQLVGWLQLAHSTGHEELHHRWPFVIEDEPHLPRFRHTNRRSVQRRVALVGPRGATTTDIEWLHWQRKEGRESKRAGYVICVLDG